MISSSSWAESRGMAEYAEADACLYQNPFHMLPMHPATGLMAKDSTGTSPSSATGQGATPAMCNPLMVMEASLGTACQK